MKKAIIVIIIALIIISLGYFGILTKKNFEHHSLLEELHQLEKLPVNVDYSIDTSALIMVHSELHNVHPFYTEKRASSILSYPCTNCHSVQLSDLQLKKQNGEKLAHWDIDLLHAEVQVMNCLTCHNSSNFNQLKFLTGKSLNYNESHKLCAQCHSNQHNDWQGGAHGKALSGWEGPRQVKTCVSCHNPHEPKLEKRWPSRLNKVK